MVIRLLQTSDISDLSEIYYQSVSQLTKLLYSEEQVKAWSSFAHSSAFHDFVMGPKTYLLQEDGQTMAFCGYRPNGHIQSLYSSPLGKGKGYGKTLLEYVLKEAHKDGIENFHTEASFLSKKVFEKVGFKVKEMEEVFYEGVSFKRYAMILQRATP